MRKNAATSPSAFTLVELMIGAALSAAIMAAVLSSYIYLGRNLSRLANQQTLESEGRRTLAMFTQDVQTATGVSVTALTAPDFSITFTLANSSTGADRVTYYYSRAGTSTSISGNTIVVPANSLVRVIGTASAITQPAQTILRNVITTDDGCYIRFFDSTGRPYDNNSAPYTPVMTYAAGINQASLSFSTQLGNADNGTRTLVYQVTSGSVVMRNKPYLQ